jgi:hypothetical protein
MRKPLATLVMLGAIALGTPQPAVAADKGLPRLQISENGHFIVQEDGDPFFYLADTGWLLFRRLKLEDADLYLRERAAQMFTVIQAVVLFRGLDQPNAYGHLPFIDNDLSRSNEDYFKDVDAIVNLAESHGLYVAMTPFWASAYMKPGKELFDAGSAYRFGLYLGKRYRNKAVIWVLGGDNKVSPSQVPIYRELARGLSEGDGGTHLKTFHPYGVDYEKGPQERGDHSSRYFHHDAWLDFNMIQSGHRILNDNYALIAADYALKPAKPVVDGEPGYENISDCLKPSASDVPVHGAWDVRRAAWGAVLAGAAGHTYGCNEVYAFWTPGTSHPKWGAINRIHWKRAIKLPGATQMQHLRTLVESRPMLKRIPDQTIIEGDMSPPPDTILAARAEDGSYAFIYSASGKPFKARMDKIAGPKVKAWWFNPRTGEATIIGEFENKGYREFQSPDKNENLDWVLVLDDAAKNFPPPGKRN